ncbi:unnamed protein product, partial [Scytosiphon promiscuus]
TALDIKTCCNPYPEAEPCVLSKKACEPREAAAAITDSMSFSQDDAAASAREPAIGCTGDVEAPSTRRNSCGGVYPGVWKTRGRAGVLACREWTKQVISRTWFDSAVCGVILVNCVFLALDDPTAESPPRWQEVVDIIFTAIFTLEMSLKLVALGLQYFTDAWNWLDAVVVFEGIFSVFFDGGPSVKSLRVLRVLRPLRTVRRMPRVQLVVTSLLRAGWTLGRIVCIFMVWLTIFAIMGVLLWSGALENRCSSPELVSSDTVGGVCGVHTEHSDDISPFCSSLELLDTPYTCEEGETCEDYGSSPYSGMVNFDNLLWSLLTLFTVTTLEGWHEVLMFTQRVMSQYTIWFFVFLIVTATWAVMSLMIAAMLARFKSVSLAEGLRLMEERAAARALSKALRSENARANHVQALVRGAKEMKGAVAKGGAEVGGALVRGGDAIAKGGVGVLVAAPNLAAGLISAHAENKPEGRTARLIRQASGVRDSVKGCVSHPRVGDAVVCEDSLFSQQAIHWAIVLNVIVVGMGGHNIGQKKADILSDMETVLTIIFTVEAGLKITVLGARRYFKSRWNRFDFFVSTTSLLHLIVTTLVDNLTVTASLRLLNVLRVFRVLRMRRLKRTVATVVGVVIKSARDLWPVVALMLLMCFVFTVLGMQLFGAALDPALEEYAVHSYAVKTRFDTFFWSFVFTVIAGDSWNAIMYRTMENTSAISALFFVALIVLGESVLLNLVLAVVLEGASDQMKEKHAAQKFRDNTLRIFHSQYKRLAIRRWNAKVRAETLLKRGQVLVLPANTADKLGLLDFPRPALYRPCSSSPSPPSASSLADACASAALRSSPTSGNGRRSPSFAGRHLSRASAPSARSSRRPTSASPVSGPPAAAVSNPSPSPPQRHRTDASGPAPTLALRLPADVAAADSAAASTDDNSGPVAVETLMTPSNEFDAVWGEGWERQKQGAKPRIRQRDGSSLHHHEAGKTMEKRLHKEVCFDENNGVFFPASSRSSSNLGRVVEARPFGENAEHADAEKLMAPAGEFDAAWGKDWLREQERRGRTLRVDREEAKQRQEKEIRRAGSAGHCSRGTPAARGDTDWSPSSSPSIQLELEAKALQHGEYPENTNAETLMTPASEFDTAWGEGWRRERRKGGETPRVDHENAKERAGKGERREGKIAGRSQGREGGDQQQLLLASAGLQRRSDKGSTPATPRSRAARERQRKADAKDETARWPSPPHSDEVYGVVEHDADGVKNSANGTSGRDAEINDERQSFAPLTEASTTWDRDDEKGRGSLDTRGETFKVHPDFRFWRSNRATFSAPEHIFCFAKACNTTTTSQRLVRSIRGKLYPVQPHATSKKTPLKHGLGRGWSTTSQGYLHNVRTTVQEFPKALYGVFSDMVMKKETPRWWNFLDHVFGVRMDRATWVRWHVRKSPTRQWCGSIVAGRHFETVMAGFVIGSIVLSLYETEELTSLPGALDTMCLLAFCAELGLRAGVHSWWVGPDAVLRNAWVLLDVYLVVSHGVCTSASIIGIHTMSRAKKVLKSARPLRIIHRVRSLQEMSAALVHSLRSCGTLLVLIATLMFGYSIIGVEVFGGKFYSCSDPAFPEKMSRYGEYDTTNDLWISAPCTGDWVNPETGLAETRDFEWKNYVYHFDSIGPALLSSMIVTTLDGWVEIYQEATNAYMVDHQPSENCNLNAFWFFFGGIIVFGFYITNLFVGVMFEAFLSYKNMDSRGSLISQAERRWRDYEKRLCQVVPVVAPCSCIGCPWRSRIQRLVLAARFNNFIVMVLVINAVVLALDHANAPDWQLTAQDAFNNTFALIFLVEACLMLYGLGLRCYFSTGRQIFEFVVTVASLIDLTMDLSGVCSGHDFVVLTLVRSLRVVRVIRLATHIPGFDQILAACTYPARVLLNVFLLLAIGVYVFANIGVALFSEVEIEKTTMNLYQDFSSVSRAMQLLFIVATGEAWAEYASKIAEGGDHSELVVFTFFVTFVVVMQFILTNLFIMVIVETFETLNAMERQDLEDAIPCFQEVWTVFDPKGSGDLPPRHLFEFLLGLGKPLGAAGNHALAGRYATMLKSSAGFDYSFQKVLVGLGAALLSDENHAHLKTGGYRPVNLKKIMATLVVQRALKRNMMRSKGKFSLADIVLTAEDRARKRRASKTEQQALPNDGYGFTGRHQGDNTRRLSLTERLSVMGQDGLGGYQQDRAAGEGRTGSIFLPPDADESKWLMRRFLIDLQRSNDRNDSENFLPRSRRGSAVSGVPEGRDGHRQDVFATAAAAAAAAGASDPLRLQPCSGCSEAKTEIGSPAVR